MNNKFEIYQLEPAIIESLNVLGYLEPTAIQQQVIPAALKGSDIVGQSQTGSGKTAAFAIPLCQNVVWEQNAPQTLVLEPTRELTVQVKEEIAQIGRTKRLKVPDVFGGFPIDKQIQTLKQKSHIVVATPGRLMDHIRRGSIKLECIRMVVIDEADLMLDMGFLPEVAEILEHLQGRSQTMLFSATITTEIEALVRKYLVKPERISIEASAEQQANIVQKLYVTDKDEKYEVFHRLLMYENPDSAMIFCGTKEMVNVLCRKLRKDGVKCGMIHGDIDQQDRIRTVNAFREGRFRYLIATDVVARGIDFEHLSHVFNYDFPTGRETYVHRIGRTGRNGDSGRAISLITEEDLRMKRMVELYLRTDLSCDELPELTEERKAKFQKRQEEKPELKKKKGADFKKTIMKLTISGGKKSKMRAVDIVGTICSIPGISADDIGIIDVRDSLTYVEILNKKGRLVLDALQDKTIKGKIRKVRASR